MMRPLSQSALALLALLAALPLAAQQVGFRAPAHPGDAAADAVMRDLAERVLPVYQEDNQDLYLENLSALQLAAGSYAAAIATRQTLRERHAGSLMQHPDGRYVLFEVYAQARAREADAKVPFAQAFQQAFREIVGPLNDQSAYAVTTWHGTPPASLRQSVQAAFDQRRARDAIPVGDAVALIRSYVAFEAARAGSPLLGALQAEDEQRRYTNEERVRIGTADGGSIVALLVRPKQADKPLPTLLEFTIYAGSPNYAKECAAHGYVGVVAYTRELPEGPYRVDPFRTDGADARAVIDWIVHQPWSDGRVGMYGASYSGFTQWSAATQLPAALKAIAASSANAPGIDFPMRGNVFRNSAYRWAFNVTNRKGWDDTYNDARWHQLEQDWYRSGKSYFELDYTNGHPNRAFHSWLHHPSYDQFWQRLIPFQQQFAKVNIPVLTTAGYYGGDLAGALYYFTQHQHYDPQADHTLLVGPYDDSAMQRGPLATLRGYELDTSALLDLRELRYRWFDAVFQGTERPAILSDRVNFELMGANEWLHAGSIETMSNSRLRLYLDPATGSDAHRLSVQPAAGFVPQSVSLQERSDAAWTEPFELLSKQLPLHNAIAYFSEPLTADTDLSGEFSGELDFMVNKQDFDLEFAAFEQLSSGEYVSLFDPSYVFRASYAGDREHRRLLRAGERQQLKFTIERLTSRRLRPGSRLVLTLGVNKTPEQQVNYGTGNDVSAESIEDAEEPIKVRWYGGSYVDVPLEK